MNVQRTSLGTRPRKPPVEIRTSARRRKTASAFWQDGRVVVVLPERLSRAQKTELVDGLVERVLAQRPHIATTDTDLERRAAELSSRYLDGILPASIRWVSNQRRRWGSCTSGTREIRISDRLRVVPDWVLDAVIVHELTHLIEPSHNARFRRLARRFPRMDEADTFLAGFTLGTEHAS